jgi:HK97 family phage portal protein
MKLFGFQITKAAPTQTLNSVDNRGWYSIFESFPGAWQRNIRVDHESVLAYNAVFACMTLIAGDVAKNRVKLVALDSDGIWSETTNAAFSPVLRKPNGFQTRIQFWENWMLSKLSRGNAYVLKQRDNRGVVVALYVLDPNRVKPLVTTDGAVYYELQDDNLAGLDGGGVVVPASEIIHDRFNCLFHPLVGVSPIFACGLAATQGLAIQNQSANLFSNGARPGGLLIAPGRIDPDNAKRLKEYWDNNFAGENAGKVAVLGDGMKYEGLSVDPNDAQLIEQLKWTAEVVCSTFHVPPYKIGVGALPSYNNVQALNVEYYSQCLQVHIEAAELCLDEGLGIGWGVTTNGSTYGTEFDLENLLRMDSVTQIQVLKEAAGILSPNEMRAKLDRKPAKGGDSPMVQQQNYSLEALAKRDAQEDPFGGAKPATPEPPANDDEPTEEERAEQRAMQIALLEKRVRERMNA